MTKLLAALMLVAAPALGAQNASTAASTAAQTPAPPSSTISVRSTLVLVPALVKTKGGALVYTLTANDFVVTDDGIEQKLTLEQDTGGEPLALVVLVETGGDGAGKLNQYATLGPTLDAVVGDVPHKVAVVGFDSEPTLIRGFTSDMNKVDDSMAGLEPGDQKAAILDGLSFAVDMLRKQPLQYRRAILLISETLDHGSHIPLEDALRAIGDTNTAIYSVGFSSTKAEVKHEGSKFGYVGAPPLPPGPPHGCFSKDPNADPATAPSRATQNFDCFAELLPPLRLAKMAAIAATNGLRRNVPESVAQLTGGEYFGFKDAKSLQRDLLTISNHVPNRYVLSFHPDSPHAGFHAIQLKLPNHVNLTVEARNGYWVEESQAN